MLLVINSNNLHWGVTTFSSYYCFRAGFSKGEHTLFVSNNLFADNRRRLCQRLTENASVPENAFILLQGGESLSLYDTDVEYVFRQVGWTQLFNLLLILRTV